MSILLGAIAAYLVGCVPIARLVRHLAADQPWAEFAAGTADFLKGFGAIAFFGPDASAIGQALVFAAVVAGDQWPIVGGDTGKVAFWTWFGALTALTPIAPLLFGVLWGIGFVLSGYLIVGRLVGLGLSWIALGFIAGWPVGLAVVPAAFLVLDRSRGDLERVRQGQAPKHYWNQGS